MSILVSLLVLVFNLLHRIFHIQPKISISLYIFISTTLRLIWQFILHSLQQIMPQEQSPNRTLNTLDSLPQILENAFDRHLSISLPLYISLPISLHLHISTLLPLLPLTTPQERTPSTNLKIKPRNRPRTILHHLIQFLHTKHPQRNLTHGILQ